MTGDRPMITDVQLEPYTIYMNAVGDTWDPAWAEDGALYMPGNDGSGWALACSSNLFFNRAVGEDFRALRGETVNCMAEYGGWAEKGPDGCTWKSSGCISIDGVLYLALARHRYGTDGDDPHRRQTAQNASIIKSTDHGRTWTRSAQENYDRPMFPGSRFATPYFIHYGQDGAAPAVDGADRYVYATSNNGFWCNGDYYLLGRVERSKIARLEAGDWEFYTGGDGLRAGNWSNRAEEAARIIDNPLKCGESGATYLPSIGRYILVAWHYPGDPNVDTEETRFLYYEAPKPWGPWTLIGEDVIYPEGWYCPRVLNKWQQAGEDEIQAVIVTGGDYYEMEKYYRLTLAPVRLKLGGRYPVAPAPQTVVYDSASAAIQYQGKWTAGRQDASAPGQECYSDDPGASFSLTFEGSRLRWFARKEGSLGIAAVSVDGGEERLVDQWTYCVTPQYRRLVFDSGPLPPGEHTFRVRVTGLKREKSRGTGIFSGQIEIERSHHETGRSAF